MIERRNPATLVTAPPRQERRGGTNSGIHVEEERCFATDAEVLDYWGRRLFNAQHQFLAGGSIFGLLGPIGVMQRHGATQEQIDSVIRAAGRHMPFPAHLFQDQAA